MKVTTDACLFGAYCAERLKQNAKNILDIGTGTGLLSLMLAQKNSTSLIDAVEIEEQAALQAKQNFQQSPWIERLKIHNTSIQQFSHTTKNQFDFIITNPPFFNNDLKSDQQNRNLALHSTALNFEELIHCIKKLLSPTGKFAVLLPYHRTAAFILLANDFCIEEKVLVKQTLSHNYFRSILIFGKEKVETIEKEIIIQLKPNQYSDEFIELLKEYYLYL
jgi:tRNA1Val (adenine37-N6)-methyltransferase